MAKIDLRFPHQKTRMEVQALVDEKPSVVIQLMTRSLWLKIRLRTSDAERLHRLLEKALRLTPSAETTQLPSDRAAPTKKSGRNPEDWRSD